jgi:anti-anti-sigma factor
VPTVEDDDAGGFALVVERPGGLLLLRGRLDVHVAADVRLALADAVDHGEGGDELVLDLSGLHGVDATGLGVLVGAHRRAGRAGRTLVLQDPSPAVRRVLRLTRLQRVLQVRRAAPA